MALMLSRLEPESGSSTSFTFSSELSGGGGGGTIVISDISW